MSHVSVVAGLTCVALAATAIACGSVRTLDREYVPGPATPKGWVALHLTGERGVLRARVTAENGDALAAAPEVQIVPQGGQPIAGDDSFAVVAPPGRFRLVARATGYIPADTVLSVPSGRGAAITVRLPGIRFGR